MKGGGALGTRGERGTGVASATGGTGRGGSYPRFEGALESKVNLVVYQRKLYSFLRGNAIVLSQWRSGNNELCEHVMYNMQTVMHALCRHVPKSGLQGEGRGEVSDWEQGHQHRVKHTCETELCIYIVRKYIPQTKIAVRSQVGWRPGNKRRGGWVRGNLTLPPRRTFLDAT